MSRNLPNWIQPCRPELAQVFYTRRFRKNSGKFTGVIVSWLDCRQLGFTITQKQNDMKNFLVCFEQRRSRPLKWGESAHEGTSPSHAQGLQNGLKETQLRQLCTPPQKKHKCTRQLRFQNILQLVEWSSQRVVVHVLHWIFMLMMIVCLKSSKRRFTCQHYIMTHYCRGLSNKSSKISSRTITQGTQRDFKQEKKISQCKWIQLLSSL